MAFEAAAALVAPFPPSVRYRVAGILGVVFGRVARQMRDGLFVNFSRLDGLREKTDPRSLDDVFRNFAQTLSDFFFPADVEIRVPARAMLEALRKEHPGCLFLTFHMGHWELGARAMRQWGWPVTAVYQPYRNKRFKRMIEKRRAPGVNFLPVGGRAARGVRDALRRGDVVAMLGDHPFGESGMPVKLLGERVVWPKGPVVLAVREQTPIIVAVIVRVAPHVYEAIVEEPLFPRDKTRGEVERLVQEVASKFGNVALRFPTQWYRFRRLDFDKPDLP